MSHFTIAKQVRTDYSTGSLVVRNAQEVAFCGSCQRTLAQHPVVSEADDSVICDRLFESDTAFGTHPFDYYQHPGGHITLAVDVYGSEAQIVSLIDNRPGDWDNEFANGDFHADTDDPHTRYSAVANWSDKYPTEGTITLEQTDRLDDYRRHLAYGGANDEARSAYVEGQDGFLTLKFVDEALTAKYHAHLLNVFRDKKTNDLRVGSIRIKRTIDGKYLAECVNRHCNNSSFTMSVETREDMEKFVEAVIRHGNNHAANWFVDRKVAKRTTRTFTTERYDTYSLPGCESEGFLDGPVKIPNGETLEVTVVLDETPMHNTFYKVHYYNCDTNCGDFTQLCNGNAKRPSPLSDDEVVAFLMDHNDHCTDPKCECDVRLVELVPALQYA